MPAERISQGRFRRSLLEPSTRQSSARRKLRNSQPAAPVTSLINAIYYSGVSFRITIHYTANTNRFSNPDLKTSRQPSMIGGGCPSSGIAPIGQHGKPQTDIMGPAKTGAILAPHRPLNRAALRSGTLSQTSSHCPSTPHPIARLLPFLQAPNAPLPYRCPSAAEAPLQAWI